MDARITPSPLDPKAEYDIFLARAVGMGAIVTFAGIARPQTAAGTLVSRLFLDHHPRLTKASVHDIVATASERFDLRYATAVHRYGELLPGETIVFVAAAASHRRAAFEAADYMMDRLKTDAVFWKREDSAQGSQWIEPTAADLAERSRWSE